MAIDDYEHDYEEYRARCDHIAVVSVSETKCQCMDCLLTWPKGPDFKSDFPEYDRG